MIIAGTARAAALIAGLVRLRVADVDLRPVRRVRVGVAGHHARAGAVVLAVEARDAAGSLQADLRQARLAVGDVAVAVALDRGAIVAVDAGLGVLALTGIDRATDVPLRRVVAVAGAGVLLAGGARRARGARRAARLARLGGRGRHRRGGLALGVARGLARAPRRLRSTRDHEGEGGALRNDQCQLMLLHGSPSSRTCSRPRTTPARAG